jgi:PIN domain nuclease of toxin-antitoxin system
LKGSAALKSIEGAARESRLKVSVISVWEVAMLEARGKLAFQVSCEDWVRKALQTPGLSLCPMLPEIAIESSRLPDGFYGDPADRIIVASGRKLNAAIVTRDVKILNYAKKGRVKVIKA